MTIYSGWISATIASSGTTSGEINLGKDYEFLDIVVPTIDSANVSIQVSDAGGGTFVALGSGSKVIVAGTGAFATTIKLGGYQYLKLVTSAAQTATRTFKVRGWRM